jgi:hypothetical protein
MLAPSKTRLGLPEVWSTRAGMRPLAKEENMFVSLNRYLSHLTAFEWEGRVRVESEQSTLSGIGRNYRARLIFRVKISQDLVRTVDFEEPRLLLLVLAELQLVHIVLQAEFFEGDGDLVAVRGCLIGGLARASGRRRIHIVFSLFSYKSRNRLSREKDQIMMVKSGHRRTTSCVQVDVGVGCHVC